MKRVMILAWLTCCVAVPAAFAGASRDFDGVDDVITLGSSSSLDALGGGPISVAVWLSPDTAGENGGGRIFERSGTGYITLVMSTSGNLDFQKHYATTNLRRVTSGGPIAFGAWKHVAMTWDGGAAATNIRFYVNGVQTAYGTTTSGSGTEQNNNAETWRLGNRSDGARTFDGRLAYAHFYNRVLSASEIAQLKDLPGSITSGLIGYWPLTGSGITELDQSGNGNHGTVSGASESASGPPIGSDTSAPTISNIAAGNLTATSARITWTTDEAADSQVVYGTTNAYGSSTTLDTTLLTSHAQYLTGLSASTLYHYQVKSRDAAGNLQTSPDQTFTTSAGADTTSPVISSVTASNVITTGATITWTTSEAATSRVEYGLTTSYGSLTTPDITLVTSHSVALSGLTPDTLYHYRVLSADGASNAATSGDFTFTTAASGVQAFQESAGQVVMEAEHYDAKIARSAHDWTLESAKAGFSGSGYMSALPNSGSSNNTGYVTQSPEMAFNVNFVNTGTYYVWLRTQADSGNDDSCHAGLDGAGPASADRINPGVSAGWIWKRDTMDGAPATLVISTPGLHTIHLWMREDGLRVDKLLLRKSTSSTAPSGTGPAESARTGSGDTTAPTVSAIAAGNLTASAATITWTTNEAADSQVDYGPTTAYGASTTLNTTLLTSHAHNLTGLTANTLYHYRVKSRDASGNLATSTDQTFTTAAGTDTTPPVISSVTASSITTTGATITWTTDEPASSRVEYGPTTAYGSFSPLDATLVTNHSMVLTGLAAGTRYNYRVQSENAASLSATSTNQAFDTLELSPQAGVPETVVGFNRIVVPANSDVLLTVPFNRRREAACTVTGITGSSVMVAETLPTGAFAGSYYARLTSGAGEGLWSTISSNGTGSVELADSHVLPLVQTGNTFNIYRHHTVGSVFPSSLFGVSFTNGSQVLIYENTIDAMVTNPTPSKVASYSGSGTGQWAGTGVDNGTLLKPETRFILRNNAAQQYVVYTHGGVPDYEVKVQIAPAGDLVTGTGYPVPVVLTGSGLEGNQRQVQLFDNAASGQNKSPNKTATYSGGQWTGTGVTGNEPLNASESFTLRLPASETEDTVTITKPYD